MLGMTEVLKIAELFDKDPANLVTCSPSCHLSSSSPLTWETFNNCTIWGYWIDRKFPMNHIYLLSGILFLKFSRIGQYWAYYPSRFFFFEISLSSWMSSICLRGCDIPKEARRLFWDICESSIPVLTQEQDHQNKVNIKRITRFSDWSSWL